MIYGLSRIASGRVVVFDNAILPKERYDAWVSLELVEFFDNAILSIRHMMLQRLLELVEFFDNAIFILE